MALIGFVIPEVMFVVAVLETINALQRTAAARKTDGLKEWSLTLSFVAASGGFTSDPEHTTVLENMGDVVRYVLYKEEEGAEGAEAKQSQTAFNSGPPGAPRQGQAIDYGHLWQEIEDRSKQDYLGKFFAIFQVLQLLLRVSGRTAEGLPVTPLEIMSCGHVVLAVGAYVSWWKKPYGIHHPIWLKLMDKDKTHLQAAGNQENANRSMSCLGELSRGLSKCRRAANSYYSAITSRFYSVIQQWQEDNNQSLRYRNILLVLILSPFLACFSAIHLAGWNLEFPSSGGRVLWRTLGFLFVGNVSAATAATVELAETAVGVVSTSCFVAARLCMMCLVVYSFWGLPKDAYQDVNWLTFVPQWS
ncbi:hypothetical protein EIP91_002239 [Steccherinum ochraceum]|uniref:Uncharacterized protein n=1 Tax=Steccherinum ochraceum TaxID=92696 RepID=A0A4R0RIT8_9APHY|nr:hypothetical protein EIP91_002239 [Steccherinum ochraceum]